MSLNRIIFALLLCFLHQFSALAAPPNDSLVVSRVADTYVLEVPVSKIQLRLPDANLADLSAKMRKSANDRRYFFFSDDTRGLSVSGWFEPAASFPGISKFWQDEVASWKKNALPAPLNVSTVQIDKWQAIFYDLDSGQESGKHVRAEIIQDGTWIDLHISMLNSAQPAPTRSMLEDFLKSVGVTSK